MDCKDIEFFDANEPPKGILGEFIKAGLDF